MAPTTQTLRPLACWKSILRSSRQQKSATRSLTTYRQGPVQVKTRPFQKPPAISTLPLLTPVGPVKRKIKTIAPPPSAAAACREPIKDITAGQIAVLDPAGARTSLFLRTNNEGAKVGDILLVRLKNGDPFAGVCINIRRRGVDSAILLRNQLTRVGVEMWYKIYSPNVEGIEVVERAQKRARRARLTFMRKPKHDRGSVQNIVLQYQRTKGALRAGAVVDPRTKGGKRKTKGRK